MLGLIHLINEEEDVVFESRPFFYWHFSQMLYAISLFLRFEMIDLLNHYISKA